MRTRLKEFHELAAALCAINLVHHLNLKEPNLPCSAHFGGQPVAYLADPRVFVEVEQHNLCIVTPHGTLTHEYEAEGRRLSGASTTPSRVARELHTDAGKADRTPARPLWVHHPHLQHIERILAASGEPSFSRAAETLADRRLCQPDRLRSSCSGKLSSAVVLAVPLGGPPLAQPQQGQLCRAPSFPRTPRQRRGWTARRTPGAGAKNRGASFGALPEYGIPAIRPLGNTWVRRKAFFVRSAASSLLGKV